MQSDLIILPYIKAIEEEMGKPNYNQTALVIFDVFKGQTTAAVTTCWKRMVMYHTEWLY